ncbi:hypothetical protein FRX31_019026 [Thalictrum thalictroides]|uniref:Wall-associated receptor kinase-like n=1 Tax=Thalictrum thalictroides TaxID=46969 RepID=A0A7J6W4X7_THATH|nr:hypothetical protein FRX31_019026 [Thalictrum thalictroides]
MCPMHFDDFRTFHAGLQAFFERVVRSVHDLDSPMSEIFTIYHEKVNLSLGETVGLNLRTKIAYSFGVLLMEIVSGFYACSGEGENKLFLVERMINVIHIDSVIDGRETEIVQREAVELFKICKECTGSRDERPPMEDVARRLEEIYEKYHV